MAHGIKIFSIGADQAAIKSFFHGVECGRYPLPDRDSFDLWPLLAVIAVGAWLVTPDRGSDAGALNTRGNRRFSDRDYQGALADYSKAVELDPLSAQVEDSLDHVLVMSVNPGFGGQKFIPGALEKIRQLKLARERYNLNFRIEVDGGVGPENVTELVRSGAEILVAGTSIFHTQDPAEAVRALKQLAGGALAQRA